MNRTCGTLRTASVPEWCHSEQEPPSAAMRSAVSHVKAGDSGFPQPVCPFLPGAICLMQGFPYRAFFIRAAMAESTDEQINALVHLYCGQSDGRTKHLFRQHLQVLVEMSKAEQRHELDMQLYFDLGGCARGVVH